MAGCGLAGDSHSGHHYSSAVIPVTDRGEQLRFFRSASLQLLNYPVTTAWHAPRADSNTDRAPGVLVKERYALVEVYVPLQFTADENFFRLDRFRRAGIGADLASTTKVINIVCGS